MERWYYDLGWTPTQPLWASKALADTELLTLTAKEPEREVWVRVVPYEVRTERRTVYTTLGRAAAG